MLANRSRDTSPEKLLRSALHAMGLRFRVCARPTAGLNRTADIVFRPARIAVFVDGCFWHGCATHYTAPRANADYWQEKVRRNQERDHQTDEQLAATGWQVIRVWEHDDVADAARRIAAVVAERRGQGRGGGSPSAAEPGGPRRAASSSLPATLTRGARRRSRR